MSKTLKNILLYIEVILLFIGTPLAYLYDFLPFHKIIPLVIGAIYAILLLLLDKKFNKNELGMNGFKLFRPMLLRSIGVLIVLTIATYLIIPEYLFYLPKKMTWLWVIIMLMYPVWSVIPQELIYRTFFFYRYKTLFPNSVSMIMASSITFSFMHIIFENWVAIIFSLIAGVILSIVYYRHKSLLGISIEHAIYGNLVFTTGLGTFFYIN
ncbi:MAG: CPBP family intramembrane metalloprotease [Salinivirgaceae bacterium]|nr:MAG: CPBP family intramembrane metalloprotease [Salinivirgaceae bacterium]